MAKILVLEDDVALASSWRDILRRRGHAVHLCWSSSEAIARVENEDFDLYIVDLLLDQPNQPSDDSGQRLLAHLGQRPSWIGVRFRVIGVSALSVKDQPVFAQKIFGFLDVHNFLKKPFGAKELVDAVEACLKGPQQELHSVFDRGPDGLL